LTPYEWPRAAAFGRVIPKNKIYDHSGVKTALKEIFVQEVEQIVWSYKLAPETVNLAASRQVTEIQIFRIASRTAKLDQEVLSAIDKAIPFPLIFEVVHESRVRLAAAYKRPSESDSSRWVFGEYFHGDWVPQAEQLAAFPIALDMGMLYERLLEPLVAGETAQLVESVGGTLEPFLRRTNLEKPIMLEERIAQAMAIKAQARQIERIRLRLAREKQFNKQIAINAELRMARQELQQLAKEHPPAMMEH